MYFLGDTSAPDPFSPPTPFLGRDPFSRPTPFLGADPFSRRYGRTSKLRAGPSVAIVSAGSSDAPTALEAARTLAFNGIGHALFQDIGVAPDSGAYSTASTPSAASRS